MSDFLVQFGSVEHAEAALRALGDRPFLGDRRLHRAEYAWGSAVVMDSPAAGYEPARVSGRFTAAVGRPRLRGVEHERLGADGFGLEFSRRIDSASPENAAMDLTGMGVVLVADNAGVHVITDRMGSRPVYAAWDSAGILVAVGSHLESVAFASGRERDFDLVSLGELVVHNYITFPHTSRNGIVELDPGAVTRVCFECAEPRIESGVYWEPREPEVWPTSASLFEELVDALKSAGEDVTRGCKRVAVALSGGKDSRLVMGAVPGERLAAGLTYCTRENRETDVARRVTEAFGVPQVVVRRDAEFYSGLLERGTGLLGTELRSNAHGMCVAENGQDAEFDLVLGGQLSDTLLKDHFMPMAERERLRIKPVSERLKSMAKMLLGRTGAARASASSTLGRDQAEWVLAPGILGAVRERRARRLEQVRGVRPTTAEEWFRYWPASRQDDSSHTLGNSRLFASDTLFLHSAILEVARRMSPACRAGGVLADRAFERFYGASARIENANTGLPISAPARRIRAHKKRMWKNPEAKSAFKRLGPSGQPWNDVQGSWVDSRMLQTQSPEWRRLRREVLGCDRAVALIDQVLGVPGREILAEYDDRLPETTNHLVMQIAWLVRSLEGSDAGVGVSGADGA